MLSHESEDLASFACVHSSSDKAHWKLIFFANLCKQIAYVPLRVCFCCLSCTNDSLQGCLGKQTWEDDEQ